MESKSDVKRIDRVNELFLTGFVLFLAGLFIGFLLFGNKGVNVEIDNSTGNQPAAAMTTELQEQEVEHEVEATEVVVSQNIDTSIIRVSDDVDEQIDFNPFYQEDGSGKSVQYEACVYREEKEGYDLISWIRQVDVTFPIEKGELIDSGYFWIGLSDQAKTDSNTPEEIVSAFGDQISVPFLAGWRDLNAYYDEIYYLLTHDGSIIRVHVFC